MNVKLELQNIKLGMKQSIAAFLTATARSKMMKQISHGCEDILFSQT